MPLDFSNKLSRPPKRHHHQQSATRPNTLARAHYWPDNNSKKENSNNSYNERESQEAKIQLTSRRPLNNASKPTGRLKPTRAHTKVSSSGRSADSSKLETNNNHSNSPLDPHWQPRAPSRVCRASKANPHPSQLLQPNMRANCHST